MPANQSRVGRASPAALGDYYRKAAHSVAERFINGPKKKKVASTGVIVFYKKTK